MNHLDKSSPCSERPQTEVESVCDQLNACLNFLDEQVNRITGRLAGVLRNCPESGSTDKTPPEVMLCPHADLLRGLQKRVQIAAMQIEGLISRVEL